MTEVHGLRFAEWAAAAQPKAGELVSGDDSVVVCTPTWISLAVVDGLGHGPAAAQAAGTVVRTARELGDGDVVSIADACHAALQGSRGAAISLATVSAKDRTITWLGIGNVVGTLWRGPFPARSETLPLLDGIVGDRLPPLRPTTIGIERGDVLVVTTDGVGRGFTEAFELVGSTATIAERILASRTAKDDALVLVVRYLGRPH